MQIVEFSCSAVSLSLSCYRQARYWLERYPLRFPIFFYKSWRKRRAELRSCHSHSATCGQLGTPILSKWCPLICSKLYRGEFAVSAGLLDRAGRPSLLVPLMAESLHAGVIAAILLFNVLEHQSRMMHAPGDLLVGKGPSARCLCCNLQNVSSLTLTFAAVLSTFGPSSQTILPFQPRLQGVGHLPPVQLRFCRVHCHRTSLKYSNLQQTKVGRSQTRCRDIVATDANIIINTGG